jgi:ribonuclease G
LVINCDIRETRVALIENGIIAELQIERASARGTVGNIVLGRVTRVLPGMQAAFIDVGLDRAAFLHVEDLIRPDDFEAYLSGSRKHESEERWQKGDGGRRHGPAAAAAGDGRDDDDDDDEEEAEHHHAAHAHGTPGHAGVSIHLDEDEVGDDDDEDEQDDEQDDEEHSDTDASAGDDDEQDDAENGEEGDEEPEAASGPEAGTPGSEGLQRRYESDPDSTPDAEDDLEDDIEEEEEEEEPDQEPPAAPPATQNGASSGGSRKRRRRRGRDRGAGGDSADARSKDARPQSQDARPQKDAARGRDTRRENDRDRNRGGRNDRGRHGGRPTSRVARSVPITEVVKEGDEVIVQISKEPIGTKGARVTSHVSLPGRYVVYLPTVEHVGTSKRIGSARERARLREVVEALKPPKGGLIVRTVAEGLTKKSLKADIGYLVNLWEDVSRKRDGAKAPSVLYTELDLVLKTARDLFTDEIETIVIDDKDQYARLVRFVEMFMPARVKDVHLYTGDEPIFDAYGIEDEISRALSRKVQLPSGGYLILDQAEALTAIDVNTGRYVGKGSRDLEETALKTNLEAVEEIAYQLRFRNIGGLVILDLIDMDLAQNREKVWRALEQRLAKDKAKTTINRISELGLIEMTRKRTRESLGRTMHETCFYCDGTGQVQSKTTIVYEILRQIRRERHSLPGYSVLVNAHPAVVDVMQGEERAAVQEAERRYMRRIEFNPRTEYHIEQFDLHGK